MPQRLSAVMGAQSGPQRLSEVLQGPSVAPQAPQVPQQGQRLSEVLQSPPEAPPEPTGNLFLDTSRPSTFLDNPLTRPIPLVAKTAQRASEALTEPTLDRSRLGAMARGFVGGALEGAASLASPLGLLLPQAGRAVRAIKGARDASRAAKAFQAGAPARRAEVAQIVERGRELIRPGSTATIRPRPPAPRSQVLKDVERFQQAAQRPPGGPQRLQDALGGGARGVTSPLRPRDVPTSREGLTGGRRVFRSTEAQKAVEDPRGFGFGDLDRLLSKTPDEAVEVVRRAGARPDQVQALIGELDRLKGLARSQKGGISASAATQLGGAAIGGAVGGTQGETIEDRFSNAIGGALLGAVGARAGIKGLEAVRSRGLGNTVLSLDSANLLAGPAAVRASLGGLGAIATGAAERIATGAPGMAARMSRYLATRGPQDYFNVLFRGRGAIETSRSLQPSNKVLDLVLRPFKAIDTVASRALQAGGYTADDAANLLLTGRPTSQFGQEGLQFLQKRFITQFLAKFPTVRIQSLERGIEFSPFGPAAARRGLRGVKGVLQLTPSQRRFRALAGSGAFAGGAGIGLTQDPGFGTSATLAAATGPMGLPAAMGIALGKGVRRAGLTPEALREVASEAAFAIPQLRESDLQRIFTGERFSPLGPLRRALR